MATPVFAHWCSLEHVGLQLAYLDATPQRGLPCTTPTVPKELPLAASAHPRTAAACGGMAVRACSAQGRSVRARRTCTRLAGCWDVPVMPHVRTCPGCHGHLVTAPHRTRSGDLLVANANKDSTKLVLYGGSVTPNPNPEPNPNPNPNPNPDPNPNPSPDPDPDPKTLTPPLS